LNHPFGVKIQHQSPFHMLHFAVQILGSGGTIFSPFEKSVNPAQVTSAQFGQTVLLLKLKIS